MKYVRSKDDFSNCLLYFSLAWPRGRLVWSWWLLRWPTALPTQVGIFTCTSLTLRGHSFFSHVAEKQDWLLSKLFAERYIYHTDKKENEIFLIYKEIQNGAVAKSYMTNGLLIYGEIFAHFLIYYYLILGSPSPYMTLLLLHSEFPYLWGKFDFLFYQCTHSTLHIYYMWALAAPCARALRAPVFRHLPR